MTFSCSNCQLTEIPHTIFELPKLRKCAVPYNYIQELPVQFETSHIEFLDLTSNWFAQMPSQVWEMESLRVLNLSSNRLQECTDPDVIAKNTSHLAPSELTTLIVDENPLTTWNCSFPNLHTLSLRSTNLLQFPLPIYELAMLQQLSLGSNPQLQLQSFEKSLPSVQQLDIDSCGITQLPSNFATVFPRLTSLNISWNALEDSHLSEASTKGGFSSSLQLLDATGNRLHSTSTISRLASKSLELSDVRLAQNNISSCKNMSTVSTLQRLNLSFNRLQECEEYPPHLVSLDLRSNIFEDVPNAIFHLTKLDSLYLAGNPLNPWMPTQTQYWFLGNLTNFSIQQSAFASCDYDKQRKLHDYQVCLNMTVVPTPTPTSTSRPTHTPSPTPSPTPTEQTVNESGQKIGSPKLVYILASCLVVLVAGIIVFRVLRRRREDPTLATAQSPRPKSPSSVDYNREFTAMMDEDRDSPLQYQQQTGNLRQATDYDRHLGLTNNLRRHRSVVWVDDELLAWRVDYDSVKLTQRLASSNTFVEVWIASYRLDTVAAKVLMPNSNDTGELTAIDPVVLGKFLMEAKMLSRLDHPRIVAFYGVAWQSEWEVLSIMEFMPQLDLHVFLLTLRSPEWSSQKLQIAVDVADALAYIHSMDPVLAHCGLKSSNVLLDTRGRAKLCDFGVSKYCYSSTDEDTTFNRHENATMDRIRHVIAQGASSLRWVAPEVVLGNAEYSAAVDIYSFGVLLTEMDTHTLPYSHLLDKYGRLMNDLEIQRRVAAGKLRPKVSQFCPTAIRKIVDACLSPDPNDRPTSDELLRFLRKLVAYPSKANLAPVIVERQTANIADSTSSCSYELEDVDSGDMDWSKTVDRRYVAM